ncbi:MAG: hypothetical protein AB8H47_23690 [Bacteroidia bacterium]
MQMKLIAIVFIVLCSACSQETIESLSVTVDMDQSTQSLKPGESFNLVISAINSEGLESAEVHIDALEYHQTYDDLTGKRWAITELIEIGAEAKSGEAVIAVEITTQTGRVKEQSTSVIIE